LIDAELVCVDKAFGTLDEAYKVEVRALTSTFTIFVGMFDF